MYCSYGCFKFYLKENNFTIFWFKSDKQMFAMKHLLKIWLTRLLIVQNVWQTATALMEFVKTMFVLVRKRTLFKNVISTVVK